VQAIIPEVTHTLFGRTCQMSGKYYSFGKSHENDQFPKNEDMTVQVSSLSVKIR
jgi:hypothetical protein